VIFAVALICGVIFQAIAKMTASTWSQYRELIVHVQVSAAQRAL
jgi:hypothetical protein